ncbi:hypothetical protein MKW98_011743, partial [Papaver atlanticum]
MLLVVTLIMGTVNESCSTRREFLTRNSKQANIIDYADALTKSILFLKGQLKKRGSNNLTQYF